MLNAATDSARFSHDFDIFHEAAEDVARASDADAATLRAAGYEVAPNRGAATWEEALATLANVRGNDLNAFSATIAQLQILWHLFTFREQLQAHGFPEPTVTGGHDSLHAPQISAGLFAGESERVRPRGHLRLRRRSGQSALSD